MAGEVQAVLGSPSAMLGNIKAGKARVIAVTTAERIKILPDMPTVAEQGFPGFEYAQWIGIAGPGGMPAPLVNKLSAELSKAAKAPDVGAKLADDGTVMVGSTAEQFRQHIANESARWRKVAQDTGVKLGE